MSRVYGEPVDVWTTDDGRPSRFVWRGRLYTVLRVLEHWVTSREWWRRQGQDPAAPAEREFWRVEATPGRDMQPTVFELRYDTQTEGWLLSRAWV